MPDNDTNSAQEDWLPQPNPALKSLHVMVSTWELKGRESGPVGEIQGRPTFEWMEGGYEATVTRVEPFGQDAVS